MDTEESTGVSTVDALAVLAIPPLGRLTEQQVRGIACVWDGAPLRNGTAVDLGARSATRAGADVAWYPRACRTCVSRAALVQLHQHAPGCDECRPKGGRSCSTGLTLIRLEREYRR